MIRTLFFLLLPVISFGQLCDGVLTPPITEQARYNQLQAPTTDTSTVSIYFETDYNLYNYFGSKAAVKTFVEGVFAEVQKIYLADGVKLRIDSIGYNTKPDNFNTNSSAINLTNFAAKMDSVHPTADCYMILSKATYNLGGIAYVDILQSVNDYYRVGYCNVYTSYYAYPSYSWSVYVVAHELGHMIKSQHTQWCGWLLPNGTNGAIDSCYTSEGGCNTTTASNSNGTIMSYCHINGAVNFNKGFGALPKAAINDGVFNAKINGFLKAHSCDVFDLTATSTANSINITWNGYADKYKVAYRQKGTTTWLVAPAQLFPPKTIYNLLPNTIYQVKVKPYCNSLWGTFSKIINIKTL